MARRGYRQFCGLAKALDVVGERWTLLIVRNLLLGPLRYGDLQRGLPGITTNLLAKRLREMEEAGLLEKVRLSHAATGQAYRLTDRGRALEPAIHALGRWGWKELDAGAKNSYRSFEFLLVALRRRYRGGAELGAELVVDGVPYHIVLRGDAAEIERGGLTAPDVRVTGSRAALSELFLRGTERRGLPAGVELEGDRKALEGLLDAFDREEGEPPAARSR